MLRISQTFFVILTLSILAAPAFGQGNKYVREYRRFATQAPVEEIQPAAINDVYAIHFILDGTNYETMRRLIARGGMPNVKANVIDRGATFTKAISTFPSTSTSAYQSFVTGLLPGHAGIPHLQRFDRQRKKKIDYLTMGGFNKINGDIINLNALQNPDSADLDDTATIYELLTGHPTLALYTSVRRGAAVKKPKTAPIHALWSTYVTGDIANVDRLAFKELMKQYGKPLEEVPRYTLVGLYSSDIAGHHYGATSEEVEGMLTQFDEFLSDFIDLLEQRGIRNKTYIIISADHGMHNTGQLFHFREALMDRGVAVKPKNPQLKDYLLYAADRGISSTHVYTRRPDNSFAPLDDADELRSFPLRNGEHFDLIDFILSLEPTELLIVRDGERQVEVYDGQGQHSQIQCSLLNARQWCSYHTGNSGDPLRLSGRRARQLIDGRPHSDQEWKHATADEYYTDAIIQLGTLFQDGRVGDFFVVPKRSWGLRSVKKATHGSLIRDDMHIPLFMVGPTIPHGTHDVMRTVDVYPLLLAWFGFHRPEASHDGHDPFVRYTPEDADWRALAELEQSVSKRQRTPIRNGKRLTMLAHKELQRRTRLQVRIKEYIAALENQLNDRNANRVTSKAYVRDHLAIARRVEKVTAERQRVMEEIVNLLSKNKYK